MMRKTIKTGKKKAELLNKDGKNVDAPKPQVTAKSYTFPPGGKFILNGRLNYIRKAYHADNTDMRLVFVDGTEEIVELRTLKMEALDDNGFIVIEE